MYKPRSGALLIIAGAGPVGLFLACELALARCSILVLEKAGHPHSPLKQLPFGIRGLSAPTIEALYRRGLLDELELYERLKNPHQNAQQGPCHQVGHFAGIPFYEGDIDASQWRYRLSSSTDVSLISAIEELETVLTRRAASLGVVIRRGLSITGFQQTADEVVVVLNLRARSRSLPDTLRWWILPTPRSCGRIVTPTGMYLQSQPGYIMIQDFDGGAYHNSEKPVTLEHVQQVLRRTPPEH